MSPGESIAEVGHATLAPMRWFASLGLGSLALLACHHAGPSETLATAEIHDPPAADTPTELGPSEPGLLEISVASCAIASGGRVWCRDSELLDNDAGWLAELGEVDRLWLAEETVCGRSEGKIRCIEPEDGFRPPLPLDPRGSLVSPGVGEPSTLAWDDNQQCVVDAEGTAWCRWIGYDEESPPPPLEPYPIAQVRELEMGDEIGCMLLADESVHCFFGAGILLVSDLDPGLSATVGDFCAALPSAPHCDAPIGGRADWPAPFRVLDRGRDVALGGDFACLVDARGGVGCVTLMAIAGQPNLGGTDNFMAIPGLPPLLEIDASDEHVCGRSEAGEVWCWGSNEYGQLGDGTTTSHVQPQPVKAGQWEHVRQISVGFGKSCVVLDEGIECWGWIVGGEPDPLPTEIPGVRADELVIAGEFTTCAREGKTWKCWGGETDGLEGVIGAARIVERDRIVDKPAPECEIDGKRRLTCFDGEGTQTLDMPDVIDVLPGYVDICVLLDQRVVCLSPTLPSLGRNEFAVPASTAISGVGWHGCVLDTKGKAHCWADREYEVEPIDLPAKLVSVVASVAGDCGLDRAGTVHCWGAEGSDAKPVTLALPKIAELVGSFGGICGRDVDGAVWCWGEGEDEADRRVAKKIDLPPSSQVVAGTDHFCSRASDGRVSCWGGEVESQRARVSAEFVLRPEPVDFFAG